MQNHGELLFGKKKQMSANGVMGIMSLQQWICITNE